MTDNNDFQEGREKFSSALMQGFWSEMLGLIFRNDVQLLSFDDVKSRLRLREESYKGLQDVPLDRIVGSVGRYKDFTNSFLPKNTTMRDRWSRVYARFNSLEGLPPIELYQVDDVYFVRDGNHRVSVARQLDMKTIQAYVTELHTPIDLEPGMSPEQWNVAERYAWFLEKTELNESRPMQERILLTEAYRYNELLSHIRIVQRVMGEIRQAEVSIHEAAATWYDRVYYPAIVLIRKYNIIQQFPTRTEADLYLWIVDHLLYLRDKYSHEPDKHRMSQAIIRFLESQNIPVPDDLFNEGDDPLPID